MTRSSISVLLHAHSTWAWSPAVRALACDLASGAGRPDERARHNHRDLYRGNIRWRCRRRPYPSRQGLPKRTAHALRHFRSSFRAAATDASAAFASDSLSDASFTGAQDAAASSAAVPPPPPPPASPPTRPLPQPPAPTRRSRPPPSPRRPRRPTFRLRRPRRRQHRVDPRLQPKQQRSPRHHRRQLRPLSLVSPPSPAPPHPPPPYPPPNAHAASAHVSTALTPRAAASPWPLPSSPILPYRALIDPYRALFPPFHIPPAFPYASSRPHSPHQFPPLSRVFLLSQICGAGVQP